MTRKFTASLAVAFMVAVIGFDMAASPPNPYAAPPMLALGSGQAAAGGFCGALPD